MPKRPLLPLFTTRSLDHVPNPFTDGPDWPQYLDRFHREHPAITEEALDHARHPTHGTGYEWLAAGLDGSAGDVLDLACGSCPVQPHLEYASYLGIDASDAELAAARAANRGPVAHGDITALTVPEASFDTVVISMALMLVPLADTLGEVSRVLRPGGRLLAMVPARKPVRARDSLTVAALSVALRGPGSMPHRVSPGHFKAAGESVGLRLDSAEHIRFPFPIRNRDDADLAVRSLYTPGRSVAQRRRAASLLDQLPGSTELPVPLLRLTATRL